MRFADSARAGSCGPRGLYCSVGTPLHARDDHGEIFCSETEAKRQRRLAWEAAGIAKAHSSAEAAQLIDAEEVDAWIEGFGADHELAAASLWPLTPLRSDPHRQLLRGKLEPGHPASAGRDRPRLSRSVGVEMVCREGERSRYCGNDDAIDLVMRGKALATDLSQKERAAEAVVLFTRDPDKR